MWPMKWKLLSLLKIINDDEHRMTVLYIAVTSETEKRYNDNITNEILTQKPNWRVLIIIQGPRSVKLSKWGLWSRMEEGGQMDRVVMTEDS